MGATGNVRLPVKAWRQLYAPSCAPVFCYKVEGHEPRYTHRAGKFQKSRNLRCAANFADKLPNSSGDFGDRRIANYELRIPSVKEAESRTARPARPLTPSPINPHRVRHPDALDERASVLECGAAAPLCEAGNGNQSALRRGGNRPCKAPEHQRTPKLRGTQGLPMSTPWFLSPKGHAQLGRGPPPGGPPAPGGPPKPIRGPIQSLLIPSRSLSSLRKPF